MTVGLQSTGSGVCVGSNHRETHSQLQEHGGRTSTPSKGGPLGLITPEMNIEEQIGFSKMKVMIGWSRRRFQMKEQPKQKHGVLKDVSTNLVVLKHLMTGNVS